MLHLGSWLCALALALLLAAPAHAAPITPPPSLVIQLEWAMTGTSIPTSGGINNPDGSYSFVDSASNADWALDYDVRVVADPEVHGTFTLTNLTANTTEFILTVASTVSPVGAPTTLDGGYGQVDFFDDNLSSLVQYDPVGGNPFWAGQIDSVTAATLGNVGGSASGGPGVFGNTSGLALSTVTGGPAVSSSIGIQLHFELSPGDRIVINDAAFVVVPEPDSGTLAAFALIGLAALQRRSVGR